MDKFGIFDLIEKISPLKDALKPLATQEEKQIDTAAPAAEKTENLTSPTKNAYSQKAVYAFIKRHDEISKRIDKNLKK